MASKDSTPYSGRIPLKAQTKIRKILAQHKKISNDQLDDILRRHHLRGNPQALQRAYRLRAAQRFIASIRDEDGGREILALRAHKQTEYIVIDCCNDIWQLAGIRQQLYRNKSGLESSIAKASARAKLLKRLFGG